MLLMPRFQNDLMLSIFAYEITALKLGVRLTNMKVRGIIRGKHTNKGEKKKFSIDELKKTFKIGCLIQQ